MYTRARDIILYFMPSDAKGISFNVREGRVRIFYFVPGKIFLCSWGPRKLYVLPPLARDILFGAVEYLFGACKGQRCCIFLHTLFKPVTNN